MRPLVDALAAFRQICAATEAARHSIWLTAAFVDPAFAMPDARGALFDVLDRAAARSLDVRVLFWRPNAESSGFGLTFAGTPSERDLLRSRGTRWNARWDRASRAFCHHQKSWLIDAGQPSETAFVGGINLTARVLASPGHAAGGQHDAYVEVSGPSATDVHHNFVQRWNEASERRAADGAWGESAAGCLLFPTRLSALQGDSVVQIQRTIPAGLYRDGRATPGGASYAITDGERSILAQYLQAIDAAQQTIYIENQALPAPEVSTRLEAALARGVAVALLVPAEPEEAVRAARRRGERKALFDGLERLAQYENFTLAGLAARDAQGADRAIYVHSKLMLVDDAWATIGSCNLHASSLYANSELNASFWNLVVVHALRCALFAEHLGRDAAALDDRAALALFRRVAHENRRKWTAEAAEREGLVFSLDPALYGADP